jgi:thymidylate synthase (FAD)
MTTVKLISMTQSEVFVEGKQLSPEQLIEYTARVSNPAGQEKYTDSFKLLKYLIENNHISPLEMVDFTVEIETSRAIAAQILRHWSFSFQEFSQRYAQAADYVQYPARSQDSKNRQNSIDNMSDEDKRWFFDAQVKVWSTSKDLYDEALAKGIAKEQARFLLPLNTKTRLYMKGNVRDWYFYLRLRSANGTQKEHMDIAKAIIDQVFKPNFPNIAAVAGWI